MAEIIRKERIAWLDYLRIFAIYFVVANNQYRGDLYNYILPKII